MVGKTLRRAQLGESERVSQGVNLKNYMAYCGDQTSVGHVQGNSLSVFQPYMLDFSEIEGSVRPLGLSSPGSLDLSVCFTLAMFFIYSHILSSFSQL